LQALRKKQSTGGEHWSTAEHHFHFAKETGDIYPGTEKHEENPDNDSLLPQTVIVAAGQFRRSGIPRLSLQVQNSMSKKQQTKMLLFCNELPLRSAHPRYPQPIHYGPLSATSANSAKNTTPVAKFAGSRKQTMNFRGDSQRFQGVATFCHG